MYDSGVMKGSYWTITIEDATGLKKQNVEDKCNTYVEVKYMEQYKRTHR